MSSRFFSPHRCAAAKKYLDDRETERQLREAYGSSGGGTYMGASMGASMSASTSSPLTDDAGFGGALEAAAARKRAAARLDIMAATTDVALRILRSNSFKLS
jgi:hypothetical protein